MGATNTTSNYSLSQFIATDKPAWLQDYNGDMLKIDVAIKAAKTAADSAQSTADTASSGVSTNTSAITSLSTTVSGLNTSVTNMQSSVNTIQSLIGNGTPTTTDHTIIGAINEINAYMGYRKIGRVDVSLATTQKAVFDTLFNFLNSNISSTVKGFLVFNGGSVYEFHGKYTDNFRAIMWNANAAGVPVSTTVYIANGTSKTYYTIYDSTGITKTDTSTDGDNSNWIDVYIPVLVN